MQNDDMLGACQASRKIDENFRQVYNVLRRRDLLLSVSVTSTLTECPGRTSLSGLSSTLAGEGSGGDSSGSEFSTTDDQQSSESSSSDNEADPSGGDSSSSPENDTGNKVIVFYRTI